MAQRHYKCKPILLGKCWTSHLEPQHSEIGNYHVLSLGKSQGRSDSDGGYTKHVASVNNPLLGQPHTLPLRFHVPTKIVHVFVVEYSESLWRCESGGK